jgi:gamma-butyrobetaine dioxygenase
MYEDVVIGSAAHLPNGRVVSAVRSSSGPSIDVTFENGSVTLLNEWLRDNCPCVDCRIAQTDERRWTPWLDVAVPAATSVAVSDDGMEIAWVGGHVSMFPDEVWARIDSAAHRADYTARLWRAGYEVELFDHDSVVRDLDARQSFFETFQRDGVVVVTGSPTEPGSCISFVESLGITMIHHNMGNIFDVKLDPKGYNVAFTKEALAPHHDNAQSTYPPSAQILAMLVNEADGGNSVVVNSWSVLHDLEKNDPGAIDVLTRVEVGFRQYSDDAEGFTRAPLVVRDGQGGFKHLRFSNQLMQPLPFDHPDLAEWYRAYRLLGAMVVDPAYEVTFRLNAGDTLIVHSQRVMHGRTEFTPNGPRHLQDIYFDVDDVYGLLARMKGSAKNEMVRS